MRNDAWDQECDTCELLRRVGPCFGHSIQDLILASKEESRRNEIGPGPYQIKAFLSLVRAVRELTAA